MFCYFCVEKGQTTNDMTQETDVLALIHRHCQGNEALERLLIRHSGDVAARALRIAAAHPELEIDTDFLRQAAMLHDIGCTLVNAPGICCHGSEPYIRHGILGGELLRREGLPRHARVAERHTGTGLTAAEIIRRQLPLPPQDFTPETIEEQIICYADKFYSKSHPEQEKTPQQALRSLEKFGAKGLQVFQAWRARFEPAERGNTADTCDAANDCTANEKGLKS